MWHIFFVARLALKRKVAEQDTPTIHTHYTKWLRAIMCLEDHRLKQASCNSERFPVSCTEFYSEGKCLWRIWYAISVEKWRRDGDHNDDNDKKVNGT